MSTVYVTFGYGGVGGNRFNTDQQGKEMAPTTMPPMRVSADFLNENASLIATCAGPAPRRGDAQRDIGARQNTVIAADQGEIVFVGPADATAEHIDLQPGATRIDASGCTVIPGFVDPHTHLVFAGNRRAELQQRLAGASYADIAAAGGGILATVEATRTASEDELVAGARLRLDEML